MSLGVGSRLTAMAANRVRPFVTSATAGFGQQAWRVAWAHTLGRLAPAHAREVRRRFGMLTEAECAHGRFDAAHYVAQLQQRSSATGVLPADPELHYLLAGARARYRPNVAFDPEVYAAAHPDVRVQGYEPFSYARAIGVFEARGPADALPADIPRPVRPHPLLRDILAYSATDTGSDHLIDVVVPVYRDLANTLRTLASVLAATDRARYEIVVVNDASPEPTIAEALEAMAVRGLITLRTNPQNLGFVASVNLALRVHSARDVILLNSDAEVFGDGLSRLIGHLERTPRAATVTPLSNAATILSYPIRLQDNHVPLELDARELDAMAAAVGRDAGNIELPTGVGFCMGLRRRCLEDIGPFDEAAFGRGYGEENDFCWRARGRGWTHLAATDVFVWHAGGGSFGAERETRVSHAMQVLAQRHPGYLPAVREFIHRDPLATARGRLDAARLRRMGGATLSLGRRATGGRRPGEAAATEPQASLICDIAPHWRRARIVVDGPAGFVNLPTLEADVRGDKVTALLEHLGVRCVRAPTTPEAMDTAPHMRGITDTVLGAARRTGRLAQADGRPSA